MTRREGRLVVRVGRVVRTIAAFAAFLAVLSAFPVGAREPRNPAPPPRGGEEAPPQKGSGGPPPQEGPKRDGHDRPGPGISLSHRGAGASPGGDRAKQPFMGYWDWWKKGRSGGETGRFGFGTGWNDDLSTSSSVVLTPDERALYDRWIEEYLTLSIESDKGRYERGKIYRDVHQARAKTRGPFFDPTARRRIEALMKRLHEMDEEDRPRRDRLNFLRAKMASRREGVVAALVTWIQRLENEKKALPKEKQGERRALMWKIGTLRRAKYLLSRDYERRSWKPGPRKGPRLEEAFFDDLKRFLDRVDGVLDLFGASPSKHSASPPAPWSPNDQVGFLFGLLDILVDDGPSTPTLTER